MHRSRVIALAVLALGMAVCSENTPTEPDPVGLVKSVSAGNRHTCALLNDGRAYCWGLNESGQVGDGTLRAIATEPAPVTGEVDFASVSTQGGFHSCGLDRDGAAYCWGANAHGQLGNGSTAGSTVPVRVAGDLAFQSIDEGAYYTCGLTDDGKAYCWGWSEYGQLGEAAETSTVPIPLAPELTFDLLDSGGHTVCGITTDGLTYCWGGNLYGQLGDGSTVSRSLNPVLVAGGHAYTTLDSGSHSVCGVTTSSEIYCWGAGTSGQLGTGATNDSHVPVRVSSTEEFIRAEAGGRFSCGLSIDGVAYCWGQSNYGQVGTGAVGSTTYPAPVYGNLDFKWLSAGALHACGVTVDDKVYCWGRNREGQLGDSTTVDKSVPQLVVGFPPQGSGGT